MALLPYSLRPAVIIRRNAIRKGLLGPSLLWKVVAAGVFGRSTLKKVFGKNDEPLGTWKVGGNNFVNVLNAKPPSRKERKRQKRAGLTPKLMKKLIIDQAVADARANNPNAKIVVKK